MVFLAKMKVNKPNISDSLLTFPCDFSIKVMGLANETFESAVLTIIKKHVSELKEDSLHTRLSENKRYLSITIKIIAESKEQLDAIYTELSSCEQVLVAL